LIRPCWHNGRLIRVRYAAEQKGLNIVCVSGQLPAACLGDPVRITQILLNLLSNAVKFTARGEVRLHVVADGETLSFIVSDTGVGISPADQQRLFKAFEQLDSTTTRRFGGTGLGLAISRRLAQLMAGDIEVASVAGQGSRFELRLPRQDTTEPVQIAGLALENNEAMLSGLRILAAEDNEVNQIVLEDMLLQAGAEVTLVENGRLALEAVEAAKKPFDVVLMDVQMPEMDGLEATRRLRVSHPALPVIGQTAHALREEHDKCLAAGMRASVTKPLNSALLIATILAQVKRSMPPPAAPAEDIVAINDAGVIRAIDWATLLARYGRRPEFVEKLIAMALKNYANEAERLRALADAEDFEQIGRLAHKLKGTAGSLMAGALEDAARRVMELAQTAAPETHETALEMAEELERFIDDLRLGAPG
jgi:CheY-like chemotaxis protein